MKPVGSYFREVRIGIALLSLLALVRFLMLPVFGIPFARGTNWTSLNILLFVLALAYFYRASRTAGTGYRDMLGIAFALVLSVEVLVSIGIAIDDFGGIDTYFTDPAHGGELNPLVHMGSHLVAVTLLGTLFFWGVGSLMLRFLGRKV